MARPLTIKQTGMDFAPSDPIPENSVDATADLTPIPAFTALANNTASPAAPTAVPFGDLFDDIETELDIDATLTELAGILGRAAITGDVTIAAGSNAATIPNGTVTNAKRADMAQATISGRASGAGTGVPTDLSATQVQAIVADGWTYLAFAGTNVGSVTTSKLRFGNNAGPIIAARNNANSNNINIFEVLNDRIYMGSSQAVGVTIEAGTSGSGDLQLEQITTVRPTNSNTAQTMRYRARSALSANSNGSPIQIEGGAPHGSGTPGTASLGWNNSSTSFSAGFTVGAVGGATAISLYGGALVTQQTDVGAAPTDTVANLAAWCETVRTRLRNLGITA